MRAPAATSAAARPTILLGDLVQLAKPRITLMVMLTSGIGLLLASGQTPPLGLAIAVLAGTGLVAAGGSALNHHWERDTDRLMERTAQRPLPAGRMHPDVALGYGLTLAVAGLLLLALAGNLLSALLGLIALLGYVLVYTPLKRVTSLATVVGAVPGAIPPMMGWAAASGGLDAGAGRCAGKQDTPGQAVFLRPADLLHRFLDEGQEDLRDAGATPGRFPAEVGQPAIVGPDAGPAALVVVADSGFSELAHHERSEGR